MMAHLFAALRPKRALTGARSRYSPAGCGVPKKLPQLAREVHVWTAGVKTTCAHYIHWQFNR